MTRIFISHSSKNNAEAVALRDWLVAEGWNDFFLDLDPERGIVAGERWERALNEAANRCEAVLFLVSRAWLSSRWCLKEFNLALKLNKRMFGILVEDISKAELPVELKDNWQVVSLAADTDHLMFRASLPGGKEVHVTFSKNGLAKLKNGLTKAGLDPRFFAWPPDNDPERPPYRGLRPLEAEDAGIFFGREAPTIEALDRLRGLSEAAPPRVFVVLGASGAGKSSFLRAGLLPRLKRDDRHFLPLPIVRPERAALSGETGFVQSLESALRGVGLKRTRGEVKVAVGSGAAAVRTLLSEITDALRPRALAGEEQSSPPRMVLPIDQGEELFLAEGTEEAQSFLTLISELAADPASNLIVLFTIRSDSFEYLQTAPALEEIAAQTFSLPPLPKGAYQTVIEGPAARLAHTERALKIEPALTEALLADIEDGGGKDALPLLAFTLERLYLEHGGDGDLRLAEYREIGGIRGSIEAAVEGALKATDQNPAVPRDRNARLALLRRALIPWLAGIDPETGSPRRRVAQLSEIPEEAQPLMDHLIAARLLATDILPETGERTVEPAHETLLRQWALLEGWLEEDFAALATLEGVQRAAREWEANGRDEAWLAHAAGRLEDAEAIRSREDLVGMLDVSDRAYLDACRAAETARRDKELEATRRRIRLQRSLAIVSSAAALIFAVIGVFAILQYRDAEQAKMLAENETRNAERNLNFALDATDRLALDIAQELQTNFEIPTKEKVFLANRLEENFAKLIERVNYSTDLRFRYASLLTSNAFMFFNVGQFDLATSRVERLQELLFPTTPESPSQLPPALLRSQAKLASALMHIYAMDPERARAALNEADEFFLQTKQERPEEIDVLGVLKIRLLAARAILMGMELRFSEAASIATDAHAASLRMLELISRDDEFARRQLFNIMFEMIYLRVIEADIIGEGDLDEILTDAQATLDQATDKFNSRSNQAWRYYHAIETSIESNIISNSGRAANAVEAISLAIDELRDLSLADYDNLLWRTQLTNALTTRALYAGKANDYRQADVDFAAARALQFSLKRDSKNTYLVDRADTHLKIQEGWRHLAKSKPNEALKVFTGLDARLEYYRTQFEGPYRFDDYSLFSHVGTLNAHLALEQYPEALEAGEHALALLDRIEQRNGRSGYSAARRYMILSNLLGVDDKSVFAEEWAGWFREALDSIELLAAIAPWNAQWLTARAYLLGNEAARLASIEKHSRAADFYQQAIDAQLAANRLDPARSTIVNQVYYYRERVESLAALHDWGELLNTADLALSLLPGPDGQDLAQLSTYWASFVTSLEASVKDAREFLEGGDSYVGDLEGVLRRAKLERAKIDGRSEAAVPLGGIRQETARMDPRSLDLSPVKLDGTGNVLKVSTRLGFATRPLYQGVWRTLIDDEFDEAIALFKQTLNLEEIKTRTPIERVRSIRLPFYDNGVLLEAEYTDNHGFVAVVSLLKIGKLAYHLNGTSPPIHEANKAAPIRIHNAADAAAYLRFFGAFVSSEEGAFQIVETSQEITWSSDARSDLKLAVGKVLRPLVVWPDPEREGWWRATANIQYSNAIFHVHMIIHPTGMMEMEDDEPVAADLPIEPPLYTNGGRVNRIVQRLDLYAFGETIVSDEVEALSELAQKPDAERPAHASQLAAEAASVQLATLFAVDDSAKKVKLLHKVSDANMAVKNYEMALRIQSKIVSQRRRAFAEPDFNEQQRTSLRREFGREQAKLAQLTLLTGDAERALSLANDALGKASDDELVRMQLAHAYVALDRIPDAIVIYKEEGGGKLDDRPWLDVADEQLSLLKETGRYGDVIDRFLLEAAAVRKQGTTDR